MCGHLRYGVRGHLMYFILPSLACLSEVMDLCGLVVASDVFSLLSWYVPHTTVASCLPVPEYGICEDLLCAVPSLKM